jgi:hypothetical protein
MKTLSFFLIASLFSVYIFAQQIAEQEVTGIEKVAPAFPIENMGQLGSKSLDSIPPGGLILIPESTNKRVMAFDPQTGNLLDANFIPADPVNLSTPIQVMLSKDGNHFLVSDQVKDVVVQYDLNGVFVKVFAPAGGVNNAILDNVRGIEYHPNGKLLVSNSGGGNPNAVASFDDAGNFAGNFIASGTVDPFDVFYWQATNTFLVADLTGSDAIQKYDTSGVFIQTFNSAIAFPEQIALAPNGNILAAAFSPPSGVYEYSPAGVQVGFYNPVTGNRGVYGLPNGNILTTNGSGVHEIGTNNTLIDTKISGVSARFITFVPGITSVDITFRVDMSNQTVSPDGVHITGDFQGWIPGLTPMTPEGNNIYAYTHTFNSGESIEYKFINGNDWPGAEQIPPPCQQNGNRFLTIPNQSTVLPAVCFGSCNPCGGPVQVTFLVDMSEETVSPNGVHVAGSFQGWNPSGTPMTNTGDMIYSVTVTLNEGEYHEYKFINGNDWPGEEQVPADCGISNGLGGYNRFLTIPTGGGTLNEVCFGSCYPCGFIPTEVQVTFLVDMSLESVSPNGVHLAAAFQGWDPGASAMTHLGSNIYAATFTLWNGNHYQYKFINGNTWDDEENVPAECGEDNGMGGYNRYITIPDTDTVLSLVCFSSCDTCVILPNEVDITFRVDLAEQTVSPNGVHLAGSFQGWDPGTTPMTLVSGALYEITITLTEGDHHQYKFINGNEWDGVETVPQECGEDDGMGGFNRYLDIPATNLILPEVCFSSCSPCGITPNPAPVTFIVDMSKETVAPQGVYLTGSFQGWNPSSTPMSPVGNNIFQLTVNLYEGYNYQYKFINGNSWAGEETVPEECGIDNGMGGFNRFLTVPAGGLMLPQVCFSSCDPCLPTGIELTQILNSVVLSPNPFSEKLTIHFDSVREGLLSVKLFNIFGQGLMDIRDVDVQFGLSPVSLEVKHLPAGIYFVRIGLATSNGSEILTQKVIKR